MLESGVGLALVWARNLSVFERLLAMAVAVLCFPGVPLIPLRVLGTLIVRGLVWLTVKVRSMVPAVRGFMLA